MYLSVTNFNIKNYYYLVLNGILATFSRKFLDLGGHFSSVLVLHSTAHL